MSFSPRPLVFSRIQRLEVLVEERWDSRAGLMKISDELSRRSRARSRKLRERIKELFAIELRGPLEEFVAFLKENEPDKGWEEYFPWPKTEAKIGEGSMRSLDAFDEGLLRNHGYSVGARAQHHGRRMQVLAGIYEGSIRATNSQEYMEQRGAPRSGMRLKKMADSIATFARNAKRRAGRSGQDLSAAIEHWEEDLAALKGRYYDGRFDRAFPWPSTRWTS